MSPLDTPALAQLGAALAAAARTAGQRRALVVAGGADWCRTAAVAVLAAAAPADRVWLGATAPAGMDPQPAARARHLLGGEIGALVFDAHAGFDVEAFGAAVGALRAGGLLLLLTPPLDAWPRFPDPEQARIAVHPWTAEQVSGRFLERLVRVLRDLRLPVLAEGAPLPIPAPEPPPPEPPPAPADPACRTADQCAALAAIEHVVHGHRRRPLVLSSDRGRGKSAALGIAAARLLNQGLGRVLVTAPSLEAAAVLFRHAAALWPQAQAGRGLLQEGARRLEFVAPDALILEPQEADLLLVDEAAAIPAPLLERLLRRHARVVFASTVHGYEGTGRGFAVRFRATLDRLTPGWQSLRLETPVRWAPDDPVEALAFRALLLDAAPAGEAALADAAPAEPEQLDRDALARDEATLSELFGLLVLAHYRTSPLDLRHLLDGPNVSVWVLRHNGHVAATALVAQEGGFDAGLCEEVAAGRRRPRGHLLPQSLSQHLGLAQAPRLRGARLLRIAVHPALQRRGLGRRLLAGISDWARGAGLDYIGTSFGATPELLGFWQRTGMVPVRVGLGREAASGTWSVLMLRGLTEAGEALARAARERMQAQLPAQLAEPLRELDPALALTLLQREPPLQPVLDEADRRDLRAFAAGSRGYDLCPGSLERLASAVLSDQAAPLTPAARELLLMKVMQKRPWTELARRLELPGRAQVEALLREAVGTLKP